MNHGEKLTISTFCWYHNTITTHGFRYRMDPVPGFGDRKVYCAGKYPRINNELRAGITAKEFGCPPRGNRSRNILLDIRETERNYGWGRSSRGIGWKRQVIRKQWMKNHTRRKLILDPPQTLTTLFAST